MPEQPGQVGGRIGAGGRSRDDHGSARLQRLERVVPGGSADGLHDRVDARRQAGAGLEGERGAELERTFALLLGTARHVDREARGAPEQHERRSHAPARPLHEHRLARPQCGPGEQHPVRGEIRGRQARGFGKRERGRLRDQILARNREPLGERPVDAAFREDVEMRPENLVLPEPRRTEHGVDDDLTPVGRDTRGIAPEHDRKVVLRDTDTPERPDIVVIQGGGAHLDHLPAGRRLRLGDLSQLEPVERGLGTDSGTDGCEHLGLRKLRREATAQGPSHSLSRNRSDGDHTPSHRLCRRCVQ